MSKNKYQRQRAMREPIAGIKGSIVLKGGVARYQAPDAPILPPMAPEVMPQQVRAIPITQSQSSNEVDRNREYKIRRASLGDNPTQDEMDAVVAYGLEQHRINFPHLYK